MGFYPKRISSFGKIQTSKANKIQKIMSNKTQPQIALKNLLSDLKQPIKKNTIPKVIKSIFQYLLRKIYF